MIDLQKGNVNIDIHSIQFIDRVYLLLNEEQNPPTCGSAMDVQQPSPLSSLSLRSSKKLTLIHVNWS